MVDREQGLESTKFNALDKSTGQESTCLQAFTRHPLNFLGLGRLDVLGCFK